MISLSEAHEPRFLSSGIFPSPFLGRAGLLELLQGNTIPWILYLYGLLHLSFGAFNFLGGCRGDWLCLHLCLYTFLEKACG